MFNPDWGGRDMVGYNIDLVLLNNTLGTLEPLQLERLIDSTLNKESPQDEIGIIATHVTKRLSDLVPVTTLTEAINHPEQTLPDNLQTVLMSKNFLGLRKILKHLISSEETKDFFSKGSIRSAKNLLGIFEALEKKHSPTRIATRIKELIVGQGISAEDFSSLVWEELQRYRESPLPEQSYQTLLQAVNQEFESIDQKFQSTQSQEGLPIERKLKNLLEKTEFLDLVEILTHLPLDTPNNHSANLTLALVQSFLLSVNCEAKDNQPPIITTPAPTPTPTPTLVSLLESLHQRQTA
jgi:hypothetical protein